MKATKPSKDETLEKNILKKINISIATGPIADPLPTFTGLNDDLPNIHTPLVYAITNNIARNLNLSEQEFSYLVQYSELTPNRIRMPAVVLALYHYNSQKLRAFKEKNLFDTLIEKDTFNHHYGAGLVNSAMFMLSTSPVTDHVLSEDTWLKLFKKTNLNTTDIYGSNTLMYALMNNKEKNLNFSNKIWKYLLDNSDPQILETNVKWKKKHFLIYSQYLSIKETLLISAKLKKNKIKQVHKNTNKI